MAKPPAQSPRRELPRAEWAVCASPLDDRPTDEAEWLPLPRPVTAAAALRGAGAWSLDGPQRDFDEASWWFRCRFDSPEDGHVLGLDGWATHAQGWLNGEPVFASDNMFARVRCDVREALQPAGNELLVRSAPLAAALRERRARPLWRTPMVAHQQLRWSRTTLLGRTPGWSAPAAPVGPWRDVWIGPSESFVADSVHIQVRPDGSDGIVDCALEAPPDAQVTLRLWRESAEWSVSLSEGGRPGAFRGVLRIPSIARWWPHTHGEPAVYEASVALRTPAGRFEVRLAPVGFRDVAVDTSGGGFAVAVNGVPVFCRGAVWTPIDVVTLRAAPEQYSQSLAQVRAAGMNMLRVPGTAVYEEDAFYDSCDRAGVLVWQDFMFANMDYPRGDGTFDALCEREAREQLQRLHAHPCLAVLCGNSEAEQQAAMWGAPRDAWRHPLFDDLLPRLCERFAPRVAYWPSSAHGGALPQQPAEGTSSYYGVGAYLRPLDDARTCGLRFASECLAFANVPAAATVARMTGGATLRPQHPQWKQRTPRDLGAGWDFEDVRDHYLEQLYLLDARALRSTDVERYLELSRRITGDVMAAAFAQWRRPAAGCGGALVLMLRDPWAGAGWGLLDDAGLPKPCWHILKRVLRPVTAFITDEGMNGLELHVVNDEARDRTFQLRMRAWRDGEVQVADARRTIDLAGHESRSTPLASLLDHFMDLNWSHRFGPPPCDVVSCRLDDEHGTTVAIAHHLLATRFAAAAPADPGLHATARKVAAGEWEVHIGAQRFAWGVHLDWSGMTADDDWFDLAPGDEAVVRVRGTPARFATPSIAALNARASTAIAQEDGA